jgi:aromatic ring-opening dioxygenase LigB subunit
MALSSLTLLPHSPLLVPEIGQANYSFLAKTVAAYGEIEAELETKKIDTIIVISPHGIIKNKQFSINVAPEMEINLKDFGFIPPKTIFHGDVLLADKIQAALRPEWPLNLVSEKIIDNGSAIPLYLLKKMRTNTKIIIISPAQKLSLKEQVKFGQKLQSVIINSKENIAVIASGDLSHRLQKKSPAGYSPKGTKFDNRLIEYLSDPETATNNILNMNQELIESAAECGLRPLLIILGLLHNFTWKSQLLAYQTDFGIGYLSLKFEF